MVWNRVHPFSPHLNVMSVLHKKSFQILSTFKFWPSSERFGGFGKKSLSNAFDLEVLNASWTLWWFWKKKFFKCIRPSSFERHLRSIWPLWRFGKKSIPKGSLILQNPFWHKTFRSEKEVRFTEIRFTDTRLVLFCYGGVFFEDFCMFTFISSESLFDGSKAFQKYSSLFVHLWEFWFSDADVFWGKKFKLEL